ncbi:MAG: DNA translocase FtsK 4TM domain-containing protein, partial [Holosporales bacterium]|nr:DNA translocase FtsK 4TM domain-containing protein [Holosporales bacterium]
MITRNQNNNVQRRNVKEVCFGVLLIVLSLYLFAALVGHSSLDDCFFVKSSEETSNFLGTFGAYCSNLLTQTFGCLSYLVTPLVFIWGINLINEKIHRVKHKYSLFLAFTILGSIVFNVSSAYPFFENFIKKMGLDYYAGGFVGYVLSKLVFIDILRQSEICNIAFFGIVIVWLFIAKKALFVEFDSIVGNSLKLFETIRSLPIFKAKTKKLHRSDVVWENLEESPVITPQKDVALNVNKNDKPKPSVKTNVEKLSRVGVNGGVYVLPNVELLEKHSEKEFKQDEGKIAIISAELKNVLEEFGIDGEILNARQGPVVTMFEFRPAPGIKTSRIISLSDDIARSMQAVSARIAIIPGQNAIGIELPNKTRHTVYLRELLSSDAFENMSSGIPLILGKDISGKPVMADLAKMPHLLIAGTTGSGKSVSVNDMILSILYK